MSNVKTAEKLASLASKEERKLLQIKAQFAMENAEFAKYLKKEAEAQRKITEMWNNVRDALIEAGYFDVIENENFRVSVSKVFGIKVTNLDSLPEEFTEVTKVAKMDKIKTHYELYNELPDGTADSSYYRLNKKVK